MLKYTDPTLAMVLHYWPVTVYLPVILLTIFVMALVTRAWDRRDEAARQPQLQRF